MMPALLQRTQDLLVSDVMTAPVLTVRSQATAHEAMEMMHQRRIQHLVVVDSQGRVEGVLSERDLQSAQPSAVLLPDSKMREKSLALVRIAEIMSRRPHTVTPNMPLESALERMLETKVGSIPVVDHRGLPIGIITGFDVVQLALALLSERG
jgi:acetoin utilization protein AcuB